MIPPSDQLYIEFERHTKICNCPACIHNGKPQPIANFSKDAKKPDGFNARCKDCRHSDYLKSRQNANYSEGVVSVNDNAIKTCIKCKISKPLIEFCKSKRAKDGRNSVCRKCRSVRKPKVPQIPTPPPDFKICSNKKCRLAGIYQPIDNFYKVAPHHKFRNNIDSQCKSCRSMYGKNFLQRRKNQDFPEKTMRVCTKCSGDPQPIENFGKCSAKRGGRYTVCKTCDKKRIKQWNEDNKEEVKLKRKTYYRQNIDKQTKLGKDRRFQNFGVNQQWYDQTLANQEWKCEICGSTDPRGPGIAKRFAIDHNHSCCGEKMACDKCRRGLLCFPCNSWLSRIESEWIKNAIIYLGKYNTDLSHIREALSACHLSDTPVTASS